jgi:hypothetical protein
VSAALSLLYEVNVPYLSPTYASACQQHVGTDLVVTIAFDPATV